MIHWQLMSSAARGEDVIQFTIKTGVLLSSYKKITLANFTEPVNCNIDWGDGGTDTLTASAAITHSYASDNTTYQISITGQCGGFWNTDTAVTGQDRVISIDTISSGSLKSLAYTFKRLNINRLPDIDAPNLLDMSYAAYQNTNLTQVGSITAPRLNSLFAAFYGCSKLAAAGKIAAPRLTNISYAFYNCTKLTRLPELSSMTRLITAANAFNGCKANTTSFPMLWEQSPEADGTGCFTNCFAVSLYAKYGTNCPRIGTYHPGRNGVTYVEHYGNPASCPHYGRNVKYGNTTYGSACAARQADCTQMTSTGCSVYYTQPVSSYYECGSPTGGLSKCSSSCKIAGNFPEVHDEAVAAGWAAY